VHELLLWPVPSCNHVHELLVVRRREVQFRHRSHFSVHGRVRRGELFGQRPGVVQCVSGWKIFCYGVCFDLFFMSRRTVSELGQPDWLQVLRRRLLFGRGCLRVHVLFNWPLPALGRVIVVRVLSFGDVPGLDWLHGLLQLRRRNLQLCDLPDRRVHECVPSGAVFRCGCFGLHIMRCRALPGKFRAIELCTVCCGKVLCGRSGCLLELLDRQIPRLNFCDGMFVVRRGLLLCVHWHVVVRGLPVRHGALLGGWGKRLHFVRRGAVSIRHGLDRLHLVSRRKVPNADRLCELLELCRREIQLRHWTHHRLR